MMKATMLPLQRHMMHQTCKQASQQFNSIQVRASDWIELSLANILKNWIDWIELIDTPVTTPVYSKYPRRRHRRRRHLYLL